VKNTGPHDWKPEYNAFDYLGAILILLFVFIPIITVPVFILFSIISAV